MLRRFRAGLPRHARMHGARTTGPPGEAGLAGGSPAPGRQAAGRPRDPRLRGWSRLRTRGGVFLRLDRRKHQTRGPGVDAYPGAVADLAGDDLLRGARLHLLLDGAAKRARPVDRVIAALGQVLLGAVGEVERQVAVGQAGLEPRELEVDDLAHVGARQRVEDDDVVDAVEELGPEVLAERVQDAL